jgi:dienelactone hydrolase
VKPCLKWTLVAVASITLGFAPDARAHTDLSGDLGKALACNIDYHPAAIETLKVRAEKNNTQLVAPSGVFRNFTLKSLSFGRTTKYQTTLYHPLKIKPIQQSTAVVALLHGMNANISQAGSMFNAMQALTRSERSILPGSPLDLARQQSARVPDVYAEAIDLPGCGNNCDPSPLSSFERIIDFYREYLLDLKARSDGKPLVALGFCYSAGFLIEVNRRNPGLIDGLILMGVIDPEPTAFNYSVQVESKMYQSGTLIRNPAVQPLADEVYAQSPWVSSENPTGSTPALYLIGEKDPFQSPGAMARFQSWSKKNPSRVRLQIVPGGGHGVLGPIDGHPESFPGVLAGLNELIRAASR